MLRGCMLGSQGQFLSESLRRIPLLRYWITSAAALAEWTDLSHGEPRSIFNFDPLRFGFEM